MSKKNQPELLIIIDEVSDESDLDILVGMWNEIYKSHRRNKVNELYIQGLYLENPKAEVVKLKLAELQAEIRGKIPWMNYLAEKINQLKTYDKSNTK
jgi:hypothetical protein